MDAPIMVVYNSNSKEVVDRLNGLLKDLVTPRTAHSDTMLRRACSTLAGAMHYRVHTEGKDAKGQQIGTYSPGYMVYRTGAFKNATRVSRGAKKGQLKDAGTFTKAKLKHAGKFVNVEHFKAPRPKFNRTADTKVILSLTRQMENDLAVCEQNPIQTGYGYGIGYQNDHNFDKALWCEKTYRKPILTAITQEEGELITKVVEKYIQDAIS